MTSSHMAMRTASVGNAARYAIYFAPRPGSLWWEFGCSWLGRDPATGRDCSFPQVDGLAENDIRCWTSPPRVYGWHATLAAPFRLAAGYGESDVHRVASALAGTFAAVAFDVLPVDMGDFVALAPTHAVARLTDIACSSTRRVSVLSAPLDPGDFSRRAAGDLTARQRQNLQDWGYPYTMDEFRFHMTLTGSLPAPDRVRVISALGRYLAALRPGPLNVDGISVFRQARAGASFSLTRRFGFDGSETVFNG